MSLLQTIKPRWFKAKPGKIYILPSPFGWIFGLVLLTLFTAAINYQISIIFLMTFLLAVIGMISAFEAHNNLKSLSIELIAIEDTEKEKPAQIILQIDAHHKIHYALEFQILKQIPTKFEKIPDQGLRIILPIETTHRGYFPLPTIKMSSLYPFGIFRVWSYLYFDNHYYVYPKPISPNYLPKIDTVSNIKHNIRPGEDELYDLKQVENPWQQPNRIAWKLAAKEQGWYLKNMQDNVKEQWLFSLKDLPVAPIERKLEYLSYLLQNAEYQGHLYGLKLTSKQTVFAQGKNHLQHCLRLLAAY